MINLSVVAKKQEENEKEDVKMYWKEIDRMEKLPFWVVGCQNQWVRKWPRFSKPMVMLEKE